MRGMIVAAGLGTRMRPLSFLRPKPAVPVRGIPLIAYPLALLARHGVTEVVINVHHLPDLLIDAARRYAPPGLKLHFSIEAELLDTGGGIRRAVEFLRGAEPCLILGGDMLLDADLGGLCRLHRDRGDAVTMLLRRDPRAERFGSVGVDAEGRVKGVVTVDEVSICSPFPPHRPGLGSCGAHFVGLNAHRLSWTLPDGRNACEETRAHFLRWRPALEHLVGAQPEASAGVVAI